MKDFNESYILIEALSETYSFNPRKKKNALIVFEISNPNNPNEWLRFGKHWNKISHKWEFFEKAKNCPSLACEEKHFVSNLMVNSFAKNHMLYSAQQGNFEIYKTCDSRIDNEYHDHQKG